MKQVMNSDENTGLEVQSAFHIVRMPGDGTRYDLVAVRFSSVPYLGPMGRVTGPAWLLTCGMNGKTYLFQDGDWVSGAYIAEKFALSNPHSIKQYATMVNEVIQAR